MATDVESIVLVTQAAMPFLLERGGSIVNVASVADLGGDPGMTMYNTAKGAVVNLTRSLAVEFAARGAFRTLTRWRASSSSTLLWTSRTST
jgi:meso-butanediol dehydrogenase/(S,S)-butanediol dehydrogenase/diacetyl reductase